LLYIVKQKKKEGGGFAMSKTVVAAATIIAVGIITGAWVIGSFDRYEVIATTDSVWHPRQDLNLRPPD